MRWRGGWTLTFSPGAARLIRIVDDGEGIHRDDLELAVTSHATSKLESAADLFRVRTLGFPRRSAGVDCLGKPDENSQPSRPRPKPDTNW